MMQKLVEIERRSFDALIDPGDGDRLHESDLVAQRIGYQRSHLEINAQLHARAAVLEDRSVTKLTTIGGLVI